MRAAAGRRPARARDLLIEHLHKLQDRFGHLSARHLAALAQEMGLAQTEVYEVATFYHHFDVVKEGDAAPPALTVRVCDGLSCEMAGARDLLAKLPALLGSEVRVIAAPCIGRCEQAPAVAVGQHPIGHATVAAVQAAVQAGASRRTGPKASSTSTPTGGRAATRCSRTASPASARSRRSSRPWKTPACAAWAAPVSRPVANGASCAAKPAPRLMAVNIDEGEPGTFKDRVYLERDPHRFLEGMLIAAWAVGIATIYVYLRDEYHGCRAMLEAELDKLRARPPWPGMPEIELRRGAGAYICGEESAMIESIEGKRGMPRLRPPYVAQVGLFGRPDAGAQLRNPVLGARDPGKRRRLVCRRTAATAARACARSRCRAASRARASSWRRPASPSRS